jgi:hypothetical protein
MKGLWQRWSYEPNDITKAEFTILQVEFADKTMWFADQWFRLIMTLVGWKESQHKAQWLPFTLVTKKKNANFCYLAPSECQEKGIHR